MTEAQMATAWQLEHDDTPLSEEWLDVVCVKDAEGHFVINDRFGDPVITFQATSYDWLWSAEAEDWWVATGVVETRGQVRTLARLMGAELREVVP